MKLSAYLGFVALLAAGFAAAAPAPGGEGSSPKPKKPPGPPPGKFSSAQQQCSASQSSISCCNTSSTKNHGSHTVKTTDGSFSMDCNQIIDGNSDALTSSICETTVACCYGDGCTAIAY